MIDACKIIDAVEFAKFAQNHLELWSVLKGAIIDHSKWGVGKILRIEERQDYIPLIYVEFESNAGEKRFNPESFKDGILRSIKVSSEQDLLLQKWKQEYFERNDVKRYFKKYGIHSLWHMSHRQNIQSICKTGILNYKVAYKLSPKPIDISDPNAQRWRERKEPIYKRPIHEYVPLYLNPRNAMLYKRRECQQDICIIEVDLQLLNKHEFLFTDGNAASRNTKFFNNIDDLIKIPWDVLRSSGWIDKPDGKRKMCSEVLIYPMVPIKFILKIHCMTDDTCEIVNGCNKEVTITKSLYF
jgi:hypothetical protein